MYDVSVVYDVCSVDICSICIFMRQFVCVYLGLCGLTLNHPHIDLPGDMFLINMQMLCVSVQENEPKKKNLKPIP